MTLMPHMPQDVRSLMSPPGDGSLGQDLIQRARRVGDEKALLRLIQREAGRPLNLAIIARHAPARALGSRSMGRMVRKHVSVGLALLQNPAIRQRAVELVSVIIDLDSSAFGQPFLRMTATFFPEASLLARDYLTDELLDGPDRGAASADAMGKAYLLAQGWDNLPEETLLGLLEICADDATFLLQIVAHPSATTAVWERVAANDAVPAGVGDLRLAEAMLATPARQLKSVRARARRHGGWHLLALLLIDETDPVLFDRTFEGLPPEKAIKALQDWTPSTPPPLTSEHVARLLSDTDRTVRELTFTLLGRFGLNDLTPTR